MTNQKKPRNKWIQLINIPFQMGVIIVVFAYIGKWLDDEYLTETIFTIIFTLLGVFLALYNVISQVNKMNKDE
jgi:F0F1-type ATP synthase assembly protein I